MTGEVVAERIYQTADGGRIVVLFMKPRPDCGDWVCDVVFSGALEKTMPAYGVDAVQALYLGLQLAATRLYTYEPPVHWFEHGDDLGLPTVEAIDHLRAARRQREQP